MSSFHTRIPNHFSLPARINRLGELAYNLWWTWSPDAKDLYLKIDPVLWEETNHNPVSFLRQVNRSKLNAVSGDKYFLNLYDRIFKEYDGYMANTGTWYEKQYPDRENDLIAYFSMEFGLHETLPIYAGGLGVLSGDHTKESSDLGLPFVALGFFYTEGYFTQRITEDGWQEASYQVQNFDSLPVLPVLQEDGTPMIIEVDLPGRMVMVRLWEIRVGRVPLFMLDTNVEENFPADRALSARLYSSEPDFRISQEILLGIGGVRALRKLGYQPTVWHMNEGHSAFLILERIKEFTEKGLSFEEASQLVYKSNVFTTHTPVPAGNDEFPVYIIEKYFANFWPDLNLDRTQFVDLARHNVSWGETFSMPMLAMKFSENRNAVSELHGEISRKMWQSIWPEVSVDDVPIDYITNGIHTGTWISRRLYHLYSDYLGSDWTERIDNPEMWNSIWDIPDEELWMHRMGLKTKLVDYIRERTRSMWQEGRWHPAQVVASGILLNPDALTIGFARRFAPYKRANLIMSDMERLLKLLTNPEMPVQIIFAGKSHPDHEDGKLLIQEVYRAVKDHNSAGRLVFLEDYDMKLARRLIQGVDVWLNTPRRPNEASGTSGQKAALNGVLNFSILDGWWREGYNGQNGWSIGEDIEYNDPILQDEQDTLSLYNVLENEIVPQYYQMRSSDGLPVEWISRMKESIRTLAPQFSTRRMVIEYLEGLYVPAMQHEKTSPESA